MNFPYRCLAPALRHLLAGGLLAVAAAGLQAQVVYTTDNEPGDWNDPGFWSRTPAVEDPEHPEALYPHLDGDQAVITGSSGNRNISMGEDIVLERLSVEGGRSFVPDGVSQVNITLRADLNRTESVPMFQVGSSGISTKASLTLPSGVHIHLIGGVMNFGGGPRGGNVEVTLQAGSSLSAGTLLNRTEWLMGRQSSTNRSDIRVSTLNSEAGSAFTGYFSSVKIGAVEGANALSSITGQADLRLATVHAFDVSGDVSIGKGAALGGNYGELRLPRVNAIIGGNLIVGDTVTPSSGLLDLQQTHVEVGGDVTLNLTGRVAVTIGGTSAGLRLPETSVLSITALGTDGGDANAGYFMQFTGEGTPEGLLYGLAWEGDQTLKLQSLIDSFAITWTSTLESAPQLFYDEALDTTFIGYAAIPEPGSLSLLLAAGAILGTLAGKKLLRDRRTVS